MARIGALSDQATGDDGPVSEPIGEPIDHTTQISVSFRLLWSFGALEERELCTLIEIRQAGKADAQESSWDSPIRAQFSQE